MKLICVLSIAFVLGTTSRSWADDPYKPQIVPQCTKFNVPSVGTVCGYTSIDDWKAVLAADAELARDRDQLKKATDLEAALQLQVTDLEAQVKTLQDAQKTLVDRNTKLKNDLIDLDEKYQNERVKPRWGSPIAWSIAAASTAILAGVLIYHAVD